MQSWSGLSGHHCEAWVSFLRIYYELQTFLWASEMEQTVVVRFSFQRTRPPKWSRYKNWNAIKSASYSDCSQENTFLLFWYGHCVKWSNQGINSAVTSQRVVGLSCIGSTWWHRWWNQCTFHGEGVLSRTAARRRARSWRDNLEASEFANGDTIYFLKWNHSHRWCV